MYRLLFMSDLIALAQWARFTTVYWLIVVVSIDLISTSIPIRHIAGRCNFCATPLTNWNDFPAVCLTIHNAAKVNIAGDYSVVSQFNDFAGFKQFSADEIRYANNIVAEEIRQTGLVSMYNGAFVTELPNAINWTQLNKDGTDYDLYMPQGLLFFLPRGSVSPLQVFLRGGLTTMTGDDIVTRQHLTRFDMEFGAGVAEGMEDQIGLISDTNFDAPTF